MKDSWRWSCEPDGGYSVKSAYLAQFPHVDSNIFFKELWKGLAPSKVICLVWRVALRRLPTLDNLLRRGVAVDSNRNGACFFCSQQLESAGHLFFGCNVSYRIWMSCYAWLRVETVLPIDHNIHLAHHEMWGRNKKTKVVLENNLACCYLEHLGSQECSGFQRRTSEFGRGSGYGEIEVLAVAQIFDAKFQIIFLRVGQGASDLYDGELRFTLIISSLALRDVLQMGWCYCIVMSY